MFFLVVETEKLIVRTRRSGHTLSHTLGNSGDLISISHATRLSGRLQRSGAANLRARRTLKASMTSDIPRISANAPNYATSATAPASGRIMTTSAKSTDATPPSINHTSPWISRRSRTASMILRTRY